MEQTDRSRSFVLGFDGVPWTLLSRWTNEGHLPNFQRLFENGAAGPLTSTTPATTAIAWPSITTGVRPDKHGVYAFRRIASDYTQRLNTNTDIRQPRLWDLLSPAIVGNVPITYPARGINGVMVAGMMAPTTDEGLAYPADLAVEIESEYPDYRVELDWSEYFGQQEQFLDDLDATLEARRELMRSLMDSEDWELFFYVFIEPDPLQHLIWDETVLLKYYERFDRILGEVMEYVANRDANLFVVSDHGFGPVSWIVNLNVILERNGYFTRKEEEGTRGVFRSLGVDKDLVRSTLDRLNLGELVFRNVPQPVIDAFATRIPGENRLYDVDFPNTTAFTFGFGNLYVNDAERFVDGPVDPADRAALKDEIADVLANVRDQATGEQLLDVHDGAKLFPADRRAPDLVIQGIDDVEAGTDLADNVISDAGEKSGDHRNEGVFLAWGPDIARTEVSDASVIDVAPTVLRGSGAPIPEHVDGRVLDIFEDTAPENDERQE